MKVCSYNVWSDAPRNSRWPRRRELVAEVLRSARPDSAGLQEVTLPMLRDLQERLPEYRWVGVGRDGGEAGEYTPIFYHAARWELLEQATFWLSDTCDCPGRGWDAAHCRIVTWARLREHASGRELVHCNTHFDHLGRRARRESATLLRAKAAELARGAPVIITGDFNFRETSAAYRLLTGEQPFSKLAPTDIRLRDTLRATEHPPEGPTRTFRGILGYLGFGRLDYIFVNDGFHVRRHTVLDPPAAASDHRPIIAELDLTRPAD